MKNKMQEKFERARKELEQEKKQTYGIYVNKKAMKKAVEKEGLKPKELIVKVFEDWLKKKGYLK